MPNKPDWASMCAEIAKHHGSKQAAAAALSVGPSSLTRWINGERSPKSLALQKRIQAEHARVTGHAPATGLIITCRACGAQTVIE